VALPLFRPYKVSALYRAHVALGARWVEAGEWRLPEAFADPEEEAERVRQGVGLQDVSSIGKLDLNGREVERLLTGFTPQDGLSLLRLRPDHFLLLTPPGRQGQTAEALLQTRSQTPCCAHLTDVTSALSALALVGPRAGEVLAKLTSLDIRPRAFPDGACAEAGLAKVHAIIFRKDWGGLPAYCLLLGWEFGEYGWEVLRGAGESLGLIAFGLAAARRLRGGN
ncbi:MAG: sarcosine oxidase subunit gamma family protein, partial [Candidatus Methylomirabilia bacterium]